MTDMSVPRHSLEPKPRHSVTTTFWLAKRGVYFTKRSDVEAEPEGKRKAHPLTPERVFKYRL